jgi:hypothetical protein
MLDRWGFFYGLKYNIPYSLIKFACDNNLLDTLHYYYRLRVLFTNRIIFNFSYKKASVLLNISVGATHNQIKKMIALKWVELQPNGSLKILGVNKLKSNYNELTIKVPIESTKKAQLLQFRFVLIYNNLKKQKSRIDKKTSLVKKVSKSNEIITKKENKVIMKSGGVKAFEKSIMNRVTLSNKKLGKILFRSQATGKLYQKAMNDAKLITSKAYFDVICNLDSKLLSEAKKQSECYYLIVDNGVLKKRSSNTITLLT